MSNHVLEILDIFNARHEPIGTASRAVVHRDGHWHKTFHAWMVVEEGTSAGRLLLQRRSAVKAIWPRKLDATAGGHLAPGEDPTAGALREIEEELGLTLSEERLVPVGMRIGIDEFAPGRKNYELQDVYFVRVDDLHHEWRLEASEVHALLSVRIDELLALFSTQVSRIRADVVAGASDSGGELITLDDFPPTLDNYYYRVAILAGRFMRGEEHLVI